MNYSTEEVVDRLTTADVRRSSLVTAPGPQGVYAWWCRSDRLADAAPAIPAVHPGGSDPSWSLLYVGIGPVREGDRTLADRLTRDHQKGNIGGSTFRQSLAALLRERLGLVPKAGSDRSRLTTEIPLTRWMTDNLGLSVVPRERPWEVEHGVITTLSPPLNIQGGTHPFRVEVQAARSRLRRECGLG
jgi:hypothetical protein